MTFDWSSARLPGKEESRMGCIYRRGKKYWIKYYRNGKPFSESSTSDKKAVAERLLKKREGEIAEGKLPGVVFDKVFFDELAEEFLSDYRINSKKSIARAERSVRNLRRAFEGMRVPQITTRQINSYIEMRLAEGVVNATINRELSALKRLLNLGARQTPPKVDRVPYIPMLKENNVRKGFIDYEEHVALLANLPQHVQPIVMFAYHTGWRLMEILTLQWDQVDLKECIVRLEPGDTKNDEGRTLYMDDELIAMMRGLYRQRHFRCPYVFHRNGNRIKDFRKSWKAACTKLGRPGLLFHDLRRTAVRDMIRAGIPEVVAMRISGHKTRSVFDRYNIVSQKDLKEAAVRREEYRTQKHGQLQNSYNRLHEAKKVVNILSATS